MSLLRLMDGRLRWVLVFWLFVLSAVAYLDRVNVSIAAHSIQTAHQLSNVQLGWVFSAFVAGYALFQAPGGRLADRFGPRVVIGLGVAWWSVFTTLTALVPAGAAFPLAMLIAVRFLLGAGEAVIYPAANRMVANWIPSAVRGLDMKSSAAYSMLPFLAMAICSPLGGWISDRIAGRHGKRAGRCGVAAFGLDVGSLAWFAVDPYASLDDSAQMD